MVNIVGAHQKYDQLIRSFIRWSKHMILKSVPKFVLKISINYEEDNNPYVIYLKTKDFCPVFYFFKDVSSLIITFSTNSPWFDIYHLLVYNAVGSILIGYVNIKYEIIPSPLGFIFLSIYL